MHPQAGSEEATHLVKSRGAPEKSAGHSFAGPARSVAQFDCGAFSLR